MNEQLVNALIAALREQTAAQREQTEAINRLAESNVALSDVIIQSLAGDLDEAPEQQTYLSGKPRGDMQAGKLRNRITLQESIKEQNPTTGAVINTWRDVATIWAEVSALSAREFIAARPLRARLPPG